MCIKEISVQLLYYTVNVDWRVKFRRVVQQLSYVTERLTTVTL